MYHSSFISPPPPSNMASTHTYFLLHQWFEPMQGTYSLFTKLINKEEKAITELFLLFAQALHNYCY